MDFPLAFIMMMRRRIKLLITAITQITVSLQIIIIFVFFSVLRNRIVITRTIETQISVGGM